MSQAPLFEVDRVVNVSSVPHRSPFRYPGGKTWLVPRVRTWLGSLPATPGRFLEPFAGGGITGVTVAAEELAGHVTLVELDRDVGAVWQVVTAGDAEELAERILGFELSDRAVAELLGGTPATLTERAFRTIVRNRVNRGGILAPGAGVLKRGENDRGLGSRWYPDTLARRVRELAGLRERLAFVAGDGLAVLREWSGDPRAVAFIDPPYTAGGKNAGSRLYTHWRLDHEALFAAAGAFRGDVLLTYGDSDEVRALAATHGFETRLITMKNTHHAKLNELLIGRNLDWLDAAG